MGNQLEDLLQEIRSCRVCEDSLPLGPNPIIRAARNSKILVVGQAPGTKVHHSSIPWNDPSGVRLREWMDLTPDEFYNEENLAIVPMGYCYPGKGKSGDLPPRKECADLYLDRVLKQLPDVELTLLIGQYAQKHYLGNQAQKTLTETVRAWEKYYPKYICLPHPSPRNLMWLRRNEWFEAQIIPVLQRRVHEILSNSQ